MNNFVNNCSWAPQKNKSIACIRKIDIRRKRRNWAIEQQIFFIENTVLTRMNLIKLVCAILALYQYAFCYFFQVSEEGKSDNVKF